MMNIFLCVWLLGAWTCNKIRSKIFKLLLRFKKKILFMLCLMIPYDYDCYYCCRLPEEAEKYTAKRIISKP